MWKFILFALFLNIPIFSQIPIENFTVLDNYYANHLIASDSAQLVTNKVYYPGLSKDTVRSVAIGIRAHAIYNLSSTDLYGWGEATTKSSKLGGWIGNVDFGNTEYSRSGDYKEGLVTGAAAVWFTPRRDLEFKGLSVVANGFSKYSDKQSLNTSPEHIINDNKDTKWAHVVVSSMIQYNKRFNLVLRFLTDYNYNQTVYNQLADTDSYFSNSKKSDVGMGVVVSLIEKNNRSLAITLKENKSNTEYTSSSYFPGEHAFIGTGDASISLDYSDSHVFRYLKHNLYFGIKTAGTITFPIANTYYKIELDDIVRNIDRKEYTLDWSIMAPVMIDINLFKSSIYAMIKIAPEIVANCTRSDRDFSSESQSVELNVPELSIGIKGKVGERFEFALVPNFSGNVFVTGLEMKYLMPSGNSHRGKMN